MLLLPLVPWILVTLFSIVDTPLNFSSHDPIENTVVISLENNNKESKFSNTYTDFYRKKIIWEPSKFKEYQELAEKALSDALAYWETPESIPVLSTLLSNLLVKCAVLVFDSVTPGSKSPTKKPSKRIRRAQQS